MAITPISPLGSLNQIGGLDPVSKKTSTGSTEEPGGPSFGDAIKSALNKVSELQQKADDQAVKLATGDVEDVHQAMIAMNKAKLAFDFTLQVRNKVIEAYQEVMRTQV